MWPDVILRLTDDQMRVAGSADHLLAPARRSDYRRSRHPPALGVSAAPAPVDGAMLGTTTNGTYVPADIDLDRRRAGRVIGLYLGRGPRLRRRRAPSGLLVVPPDRRDAPRRAGRRVLAAISGVKVTVRRLTTTFQVSISSRILAAWFEHVLGLGSNCYDHRMPDMIWSASDRRQASAPPRASGPATARGRCSTVARPWRSSTARSRRNSPTACSACSASRASSPARRSAAPPRARSTPTGW